MAANLNWPDFVMLPVRRESISLKQGFQSPVRIAFMV
jgi:hypothetical protein